MGDFCEQFAGLEATAADLVETDADIVIDLSHSFFRDVPPLLVEPVIKHLILDGNFLDENMDLSYMPSLRTLSLNKNKISSLDEFLSKVALSCPNLRHLSLLDNPVCPHPLSAGSNRGSEKDYTEYRLAVIRRLPCLTFLDSSAVSEADRDFPTNKNRPKQASTRNFLFSNFFGKLENLVHGTVQSKPDTASNEPTCTFDKLSYTYNGSKSEGNRFIRDRHL